MHMMLLQLYKKSSHRSSLATNQSTSNQQQHRKSESDSNEKKEKDLFREIGMREQYASAISRRQTRDEIALWRRRRRRINRERKKKEPYPELDLSRRFIDGFGGQAGSLEREAHESVDRTPFIPTPVAEISFFSLTPS